MFELLVNHKPDSYVNSISILTKINIAYICLAILTNKDLMEDLNENLEKLLPKLMELTPADTAKLPLISKRLKEFYLNGSNTIKESNGHGFVNVSTTIFLIGFENEF